MGTFMYDGIYAGSDEMGGNTRMLLMMLMTSWMIWWAVVLVGAAEVSFTIKDVTEEAYANFLDEVRAELASGRVSNGIPVMRWKSVVNTAKQRFLLVTLTNSARESITLALDVITAQVVGYQATDERSFFFSDAPKPESNSLFLDTDRTTFKFTGSYTDLTGVAKADRSSIALGITHLSAAIQDLHNWSSGSQTKLATGLIVITQMVSEAARIPYIQRAVANRGLGHDDFTSDCGMISYEDNWELLSYAIQTEVNGKFRNPIELERGNCKKYKVTTVTENIRNDLALLKSNLAISLSYQGMVAAEDQEYDNGLITALRKFNPSLIIIAI